MKGVLICGGKGERLFPITKYINNKRAIKIKGLIFIKLSKIIGEKIIKKIIIIVFL